MEQPEIEQLLDIARSNRKLWLVKVPRDVAVKWRAACELSMKATDPHDPALGAELGQIQINTDPQKNQTDMSLVTAGREDKQQLYKLNNTVTDMPNMVAFSVPQPGTSGGPRVEGTVVYKLDAALTGLTSTTAEGEMVIDPGYRDLTKRRNDAAAAKTRTVQLVDDKDSRLKMSVMAHVNKRKHVQEVQGKTLQKRVKMERGQLEAMLFALFERQDHWNFLQLQKETDQPAPFLKEVLNTVALQNKRGPLQGMYELRKEYRQQSKQS